jgi:hypothetical protein
LKSTDVSGITMLTCEKDEGVDNQADPVDSDGDGIPDQIEGDDSIDTDKDGTPDYLDLDSDNDGILDETEGSLDQDGDGLPNYRDLDSDADGIPDKVEGINDADGDGVPNYLDEDSDDDGIPDKVEGVNDPDKDGTPNYLDRDSDGDSILDVVEGSQDSDGDGTPNFLDLDSDGDGLLDSYETSVDTDSDGIPDFLDTDSDNDSVPDVIEGSVDSDKDGTPDFRDHDSDGDGISDITEGSADTDGDNIPDRLDLDSDNDCIADSKEGVPDWRNYNVTSCTTMSSSDTKDSDGDGLSDAYEGNTDVDGDGIPNYLDLDSDGDGIPDATEGSFDQDDDLVPNFLDPDSDGDGIPDKDEGVDDADKDGIPNYLDLDSDGDQILDSVECRCPSYSTTGANDADNDGIPNYLDLDSDNDGKPDTDEGTNDDNGDGLPNYVDPKEPEVPVTLDSDGDGIPDSIEGSGDSDFDGIPDYLDTDSDNDGILDSFEGVRDEDRDGKPDYLDVVKNDQRPLVCRSPGCKDLDEVEGGGITSPENLALLITLAALMALLSCCAAGSALWKWCQIRCAHCHQPIDACRSGMISVTFRSTLMLGRALGDISNVLVSGSKMGTENDTEDNHIPRNDSIVHKKFMAAYMEDIRRDICTGLQLRDSQVSVHFVGTKYDNDSEMHTTEVIIHVVPHKVAEELEEQQDDFNAEVLEDMLEFKDKVVHEKHGQGLVRHETRRHTKISDSQDAVLHEHKGDFWPAPASDGMRARHRMHHAHVDARLKRTVHDTEFSAMDLVQMFKHQSADPMSPLMRGKYTCDIIEVKDGPKVNKCNQCGKEGRDCECFCYCCGEVKGACPSICSRFCSHCATPKDICNTGDVKVLLDLKSEDILENMDTFRAAMRREISEALQIHPLQASISYKRANNSSMFHVHFISCRDAAWILARPGFGRPFFGCVNQRQSDCEHCGCLSRDELVTQFLAYCKDTNSNLRKGPIFLSLISAVNWEHQHQHLKCEYCGLGAGYCECDCPVCYHPLDSCNVDCDFDAALNLQDLIVSRKTTIEANPPLRPVRATRDTPVQPPMSPETNDPVTSRDSLSTPSTDRSAISSQLVFATFFHYQQSRVVEKAVTLVPEHLLKAQSEPEVEVESKPQNEPEQYRMSWVEDGEVVLLPESEHAPKAVTLLPEHLLKAQSEPEVEVESKPQNEPEQYRMSWVEDGEVVLLPESEHAPTHVPEPVRRSLVAIHRISRPEGVDTLEQEICHVPQRPVGAQEICDVDTSAQEICDVDTSEVKIQQHVVHQVTRDKVQKTMPTLERVSIPNLMSTLQRNSIATSPNVKEVDQSCYCGLEVSDHAPYRVLAIDDLTDPYFVVQGMPGYSNPTVVPGDCMVSIAGKSVEHISLQELHGMLRGHLHSTVDIVLARHDNPSDLYRITVLRHRYHEFDLPRSTSPQVSRPDQNCYCGLEVSDHAPYRVLAIDDLTDPYFVVQGMPGYSNPTVVPGDCMVSIAGKSVEHISLQELHGMLRGHLHSTVDIVLARYDNPSDLYRITVLRHRYHEFDLPRSTVQNLS